MLAIDVGISERQNSQWFRIVLRFPSSPTIFFIFPSVSCQAIVQAAIAAHFATSHIRVPCFRPVAKGGSWFELVVKQDHGQLKLYETQKLHNYCRYLLGFSDLSGVEMVGINLHFRKTFLASFVEMRCHCWDDDPLCPPPFWWSPWFFVSSAKSDDCRRPGTLKLDKKQRANLQEMQTAEVIELIIAAGQSSAWDIGNLWGPKNIPRTSFCW